MWNENWNESFPVYLLIPGTRWNGIEWNGVEWDLSNGSPGLQKFAAAAVQPQQQQSSQLFSLLIDILMFFELIMFIILYTIVHCF